jgi:NIMA (never in mitosis gene a)-related kinase
VKVISDKEERLAEVRILAGLNSRYVVKYFDSFMDNCTLNIVMEYCDKGDIDVFLKL